MSDLYTYTRRLTIGGGTGTFRIRSPYDGPCEFCVWAVSFGGAGGISISDEGGSYFPPVAGPTTTISQQTEQDAYPGILMVASAAQVVPLDSYFTPCTTGFLYVTVNCAGGNSILAVVSFRRPQHVEAPEFREMVTGNPLDEFEIHAARERVLAAQADVPTVRPSGGR